MAERSLLILKPDAIKRGLKDKILERIKSAGLEIKEQKEFQLDNKSAARLYRAHQGKSFFAGLVEFITSGPVLAAVVDGHDNVIERLRELMGATDPREAEAGTIRGDFKEEFVLTSSGTIKNLVHGSDSVESAKYEIPIFFPEE